MLQGQRVIFQVEVHETPFPGRRNVPLANLFGKIFALNASDIDPPAFMWPGVRSVSVQSTRTMREIVDAILQEANSQGGVLDHVVFNAHGLPDDDKDPAFDNQSPTDGSRMRIVIGEGLRRSNVREFARLRSKVRFVWFQNCVVGADNRLMGDMALHTQGRVSAPVTLTLEAKFPPRHIEIEQDNKHWDGRVTSSRPAPMDRTEFFRQARRNKTTKTDGSALDFNVVTSPRGPIP
jgi:hypothetical protein